MTSTASQSMPMTFLLLGLICCVMVTFVSGVYTGPRYGKRDSGEMSSRVMQRTSGLRTIQARSAGERRFYPGTRFGGKRTYWQPTAIVAGSTAEGNDLVLGQSTLPLAAIPYDCIYIPFVGVRCSKPGEGQGQLQEEAESRDRNENGVSPAVTGIDP